MTWDIVLGGSFLTVFWEQFNAWIRVNLTFTDASGIWAPSPLLAFLLLTVAMSLASQFIRAVRRSVNDSGPEHIGSTQEGFRND